MPNYNFIDLTGKKIERLTIIKRIEGTTPIKWLCRCDCGNYKEIWGYNLTRTHTTSCGCFNREQNQKRLRNKEKNPFYKHGKSGMRIHDIWRAIIDRCCNKKNKNYFNYGGRGITICEEWKNDFLNFYNWAIVNGYRDDLTIDRINVNGNYEPDNCRWADTDTQANNKRTNCYIEYEGETNTISEWAKKYNMKYGTLRTRLKVYKWSVEKALTTPVGKWGGELNAYR